MRRSSTHKRILAIIFALALTLQMAAPTFVWEKASAADAATSNDPVGMLSWESSATIGDVTITVSTANQVFSDSAKLKVTKLADIDEGAVDTTYAFNIAVEDSTAISDNPKVQIVFSSDKFADDSLDVALCRLEAGDAKVLYSDAETVVGAEAKKAELDKAKKTITVKEAELGDYVLLFTKAQSENDSEPKSNVDAGVAGVDSDETVDVDAGAADPGDEQAEDAGVAGVDSDETVDVDAGASDSGEEQAEDEDSCNKQVSGAESEEDKAGAAPFGEDKVGALEVSDDDAIDSEATDEQASDAVVNDDVAIDNKPADGQDDSGIHDSEDEIVDVAGNTEEDADANEVKKSLKSLLDTRVASTLGDSGTRDVIPTGVFRSADMGMILMIGLVLLAAAVILFLSVRRFSRDY